jgi:uncharacterized protein with PIN domain
MRGFFNSLLGEVLRWMSFRLQLNFDPGLAGFFLSGSRGASPIVRELREKTAVKDVIEACGVPHPEIDLIVVLDSNRESAFSVDLFWQAAGPARLDVYGFPAPADILPLAPRLQGHHFERFVADGHLGKLARNLRLLGLDTVYRREADDRFLLRTMLAENRAILTRDRRLLMHSVVQHGYCPRSAQPEEQTREILRRFGLLEMPMSIAPFVRCLECNGLLEAVTKEQVADRLSGEPLTLRFHDQFSTCPNCGRIYWEGSHFDKLKKRISKLLMP